MTNDITLTFSKHRGKRLSEVPQEYLRWLAQQSNFFDPSIPAAAATYLNELRGTQQRQEQSSRVDEPTPMHTERCIKCQKPSLKDTGYVFRLHVLGSTRHVFMHSACFEELGV